MASEKFKKFLVIVLVVIASFLLHVNFVSGEESNLNITPIMANPEENIIDDNGDIEITDEALKLEIKIINQEVISRKITVELTINPSIDSGKVAIDWVCNTDLFTIVGDSRDVVTLNKDKELKITKDFIPKTIYKRNADFDAKITVRVTATAYDINYLSTRILSFTMNPKYEITPLLSGYNIVKNITFYGGIALIIISSSVLIALFALLLNKFLIYLNSDEEK
jgi:hypothetical protein